MTDLDLHNELRNSGVRFSSELRKYTKMNLTSEQWEFAFSFLHLTIKEIKENYKENDILS